MAYPLNPADTNMEAPPKSGRACFRTTRYETHARVARTVPPASRRVALPEPSASEKADFRYVNNLSTIIVILAASTATVRGQDCSTATVRVRSGRSSLPQGEASRRRAPAASVAACCAVAVG